MRIDALNLIAFGPFTGTALDFSKGSQGFHLVYGPNEAGKSSALRALRALLFGIAERSPDGFLHPYPKMRIQGTLRSASGDRLDIIRRKGRANTLRAADDHTVVPESELSAFLNNVDADLFATMFGIGYEDLVAGGREIVAGGGDLGQVIFSAGSGIVRLKEVRDNLNAEAENLFKPSGKNPAVNEALSRLRENEKNLRETLLPGNQWARLDADLREAMARREAVEAQLSENERTRGHLSRIREALPLIARRRELLDALKSYENVVLLPDDFSDTRRDLATQRDAAQREAERAGRAVAAIEKEMAELPSTDAILGNAALIEECHQQLGGQQKAAADRVKLETRRSTLLAEAGDILRGLSGELSLDDAEKLRIKKDRAAAIRRLSGEYEQITARLESARETLSSLGDEIENLQQRRHALAEPRDPSLLEALGRALSEAADYGPLENQNSQTLSALESREKSLQNRLERLGLPGRDSIALEKLPLPSLETVDLYEDRFDTADRRITEISREKEKINEQIRQAESRIQARQKAQAVPTEADLESARAQRNQGWQLIREKLAGSEPDDTALAAYQSQVPEAEGLCGVFEHHLHAADELSDRLRREADRVADHARLESELATSKNRKIELDEAADKAEKERAALTGQWLDCWRAVGITPETPREMARWIREVTDLKEAVAANEENLRNARRTAQAVAGHRQTLAEQLLVLENQSQQQAGAPDLRARPLSRLIHRGRQLLESEKALCDRIEQIETELSSRKKELSAARARQKTAEEDLQQWRSSWESAVAPLGLSGDARPAEAAEVLEEVRSLFEKLKAADALAQRIRGIENDAESFAQSVFSLAKAAAPDLTEKPPQEIALNLHRRLTRSREAHTRYKELDKQLAKERENLESARKTVAGLDAQLLRMCEEAGCAVYADLPEAEERSRKRRELEAELKSVEERILSLSAGATVEEFVQAAAELDPDTIDPEIQRLEEQIKVLSSEKTSLTENIGSLRNELDRMDGSARAAALAEERQEILGRLEPDARRYARARIATHILDLAIERYRDRNQGPMLNRASALFAGITCGAFAGVRAEFDGSGQPVIAGVRRDGEPVHVSGMSDGTADQLYLALRLAGLETAIEKSGPMPFIVDDILIKFDNERAAAALKVLADLSARTQVIFFTHHQHLLEIAEQHLPETAFILHHL